jgi:hypothetical protein
VNTVGVAQGYVPFTDLRMESSAGSVDGQSGIR